MPLTIVLDTSPLSTVTKRLGVSEADECRRWLARCVRAGHRILAPAVAYYEVARELHRAGNTAGVGRLAAFCSVPGRYLPLTDAALRRAALLWVQARIGGLPTADPKELDCDVLIASQALELGLTSGQIVIATMNVGHLSRFVNADHWANIC